MSSKRTCTFPAVQRPSRGGLTSSVKRSARHGEALRYGPSGTPAGEGHQSHMRRAVGNGADGRAVLPRGFARRRSRVALAVVLVFVTACAVACSPHPREAVPAIVAPSPSDTTGGTTQFSVTADEPVDWGLLESRDVSPRSDLQYPLEVSKDGRYLVDQRGTPWRVQADAAWLLSSGATPAQVDEYLSIRSAQGFNSFYLMAMVHQNGYAQYGAPDAPDNYAGDPPFATPGVFSTAGASAASARYWAWIDSIIARAAQFHMVVMLAYTYLGWSGGDQGWYQDVLEQPDRQALFDWGVWLGNRYKNTPNLIWFGLGDFTPPAGSEGAARVQLIAEGIKSAGASQPFMAEPSPPDNLPGDVPEFGDLLSMNSFYGHGPDGIGTVYEAADRAWRSKPTRPAWMQEGTYEYENNLGHMSAQPWDTRRGRFWAVLAGGTAGEGFGTHGMLDLDIPNSLNTPGAAYSTAAFALFASMPWWELQPSGTDPGFDGRDLVTSGAGTWGGLDRITSAATADHEWLLAYVPVTRDGGKRTFTVDMSVLSGPARARWFDPATGNYIAISNGFDDQATGPRTFTTPGARQDGTNDWVLVVDSTGHAPCGSITPSGEYTAPRVSSDGVRCEITAALKTDPSKFSQSPVVLAGN